MESGFSWCYADRSGRLKLRRGGQLHQSVDFQISLRVRGTPRSKQTQDQIEKRLMIRAKHSKPVNNGGSMFYVPPLRTL